MANIFSSVRVTRPKRTAFSLSHSSLFTTNFGRCTPGCFVDLVPGDTVKLNSVPLVRFAPMSSPPFGKVDTSSVWFAVPMRLVNGKFQKFITGYYQDTSGSSNFLKRPNMMLTFPGNNNSEINKYFDVNQYRRYSLFDYLGIVTAKGGAPQYDSFEAARFLAFWMVYYEYFVDQNVGYCPDSFLFPSGYQGSIGIRTEDGKLIETKSILNWEQFTQIVLYNSADYPAISGYVTIGDLIREGLNINFSKISKYLYPWLFALPSKCWPKDYFTSALPWAQKGEPVTVPVSLFQEGTPMGVDISYVPNGGSTYVHTDDGSAGGDLSTNPTGQLTSGGKSASLDNSHSLKGTLNWGSNPSALAFSINDLRSSYALQSWLERNARCGSRYIEQILSHFGVRSSDARLQRPEYLGGFKIPVHVSSVAQTSEDGATPQGNLAGNALSSGSGKSITFFAEEHCLLINIVYVQPKAVYSQGVSRLLRRREFYDFYFPEFSHLGEQEIKVGELYYDSTSVAKNNSTFGYQSRYSEYKFMNNELHGDFLHPSLKSWIFGDRSFSGTPALSPQFLQCSPSLEKSLINPWPVVDEDSFDKMYVQVDYDIKALRPMPKYGTPYL